MAQKQSPTVPSIVMNLSLVFICLTLVFLSTGFWGAGEANAPPQNLDPNWYQPVTARGMTLENKPLVGNCFICHMSLVPDPGVVQPRFTHKKIKLDHGTNDRCFNCHWILDRNYFTPDHGPGIVHRQVELLCSRCHGPIYKDWQAGTHGLKQGRWDQPTIYNTRTHTCTQCHDPHKPQFEFTAIAPAPHWPARFSRPVPDYLTPAAHGKEAL
ncbi:MAG: hypothetical protein MI747_07005 [Desulfobacterales bacterium]|nr:hypothetical protein [Desulfobacterales bacterium]